VAFSITNARSGHMEVTARITNVSDSFELWRQGAGQEIIKLPCRNLSSAEKTSLPNIWN